MNKTIKKVNVKNMVSNSGNSIPNQFIILINGVGTFFQSYDYIIVFQDGFRTYLDSYYWDYSVTTGKYRNQFLGETKQETQKKIDSGEYVLCDLN